tara:strand:- start:58 stop:450 length:393 start_codon:yes stop_codon:yes gene_type:complete
MHIFWLKFLGWTKTAWSWITEHWKLTLSALAAATIFILGFVKGSKGKRKAEALKDLAEKDSEAYKKNNEAFKERVETLVAESKTEADKIEKDRLDAHKKAEDAAAQNKEELNDSKKLDKILKDKFNLKGE